MSDDVLTAIESARDMITALCKPRGSEGSREWIMSIPARIDRDPDLVIGNALTKARGAIERLTRELSDAQIAEIEMAKKCDAAEAALSEARDLVRDLRAALKDIANGACNRKAAALKALAVPLPASWSSPAKEPTA